MKNILTINQPIDDDPNFNGKSICEYIEKITFKDGITAYAPSWFRIFDSLIIRNQDFYIEDVCIQYIKSKGLEITDEAIKINTLNKLRFKSLQVIEEYISPEKLQLRKARKESHYRIIDFELSTVFRFGKYKTHTLLQVVMKDPRYIIWCVNNLDHFFLNDNTICKLISQFNFIFPHNINSIMILRKVAMIQEELLKFEADSTIDKFQTIRDFILLKECSWDTKTKDGQTYKESIDRCLEIARSGLFDDEEDFDELFALNSICWEVIEDKNKFLSLDFYKELLFYQNCDYNENDFGRFQYDLKLKTQRWEAKQKLFFFIDPFITKYDVTINELGLVIDNKTGVTYVLPKNIMNLENKLRPKHKSYSYPYNERGYCGACMESPCMCSDREY